MLGEEAQLARGAPALALDPRLWQAGFLRCDLGDLCRARLDLVGDGVQEGGALGAGGLAIAPESILGGLAGLVHQIGCCITKLTHRPMGGRRGECRFAGNPFACNQVLAM